MPIHKFSLPRAALLLALGCAAFPTTARADEASLERAAQAQPEAPKADKAAFDKLSDGKDLGFKQVTHADYQSAVELQEFVDQLRKKRS